MFRILFLTFVLSTLDGVLTVVEAQSGVEEVNPLMRHFFSRPAAFLLVKSLIVGSGILVLWTRRRHTHIVIPGTILVFGFYVAVIAFHVWGLAQM